MRNNEAPDHIVTKEEFYEYYNNVSASIDTDEYFGVMMNSAWNFDHSKVAKAGWSSAGPSTSTTAKGASVNTRGGAQRPAAQPNPNDVYAHGAALTDKQLCEVMTKKLAARGSRGIAGLGRSFRIADDDNSKSLGMDEFKKAIHDFRIGLNENDTARLFAIFDRDQSGSIDYDEFLRGVVGEMNEYRFGLVK